MGILNFSREAQEVQQYTGLAIENQRLEEENNYVLSKVEELQEDLLRISDAFDRRGTKELTGLAEDDASEIPLGTVKRVASTSRAMNAMNPFVKRGVNARISYVWGKGVSFDKVEGVQELMDDNRKRMFSPQAFEERERVLATDGNLFLAHPNEEARGDGDTTFRIVLDQITGSVSNPEDKEEIWYYKREWNVDTTNGTTGEQQSKGYTRWYPSMAYAQKLEKQNKALPRRWGKHGVDQKFVIQHETVNKQVGWRWGVPDIMPVIFWAKAYKEYLEDNATLVKAYSRLAWQVKAPAGQNGPGIAAQLMSPPTRDPMTGELRDVGGTAVSGGGVEMAPLATNASSIDFSKGAPLASAIASGLEVSMVVITSDAGTANRSAAESLDLPTLKAMESRQQLHTESFLELFKFWGVTEPTVTWPQIYNDTTKDRITAVGTARELNLLYPEEGRKEVLDVLGIAPFKPWDELPDPADDPLKQYEEEKADKAFEQAQQQANAESAAQKDASVIAGQGKSGGVSARGGAQSSSNQARTNRARDSKTS